MRAQKRALNQTRGWWSPWKASQNRLRMISLSYTEERYETQQRTGHSLRIVGRKNKTQGTFRDLKCFLVPTDAITHLPMYLAGALPCSVDLTNYHLTFPTFIFF